MMAKTAAQRMRESRERKRNAQQAESATSVTKPERPSVTKCQTDQEPCLHHIPVSNKCEAKQNCSADSQYCQADNCPLTVYSRARWAFLVSRGHTWDTNLQRSTRAAEHGTIVVGVTVPGDPAYDGIYQQSTVL
jgi:hypothetical protein